MNYRDERDALRGRVEGLEQELEDARRSQMDEAAKRARIEQIEARMRETEANMNEMRRELGALRGKPPAKKNLMPLWIGIAMVFLGAIMSGFLLVRAPAPPPPYVERAVATVVPVPEAPPIPAIPTENPSRPPKAARQVKAQWTGKVSRINALGLAPGAPCVIDATLESEGDKQRVSQLTVKCADKVIYDSTHQLNGMSSMGYGMAEEPGKTSGTYSYALNYSDIGARSGQRTQVSIDTTQQHGFVFSEVVPVFRVEFSVAKLSAPVQGQALMPNDKYLEPR